MTELATNKADALARIAQDIKNDGVTPELAAGATQLVFGVGDPDAAVMFIGEAPGANEDKQGEPFVGAAGQFLNEMLASIGFKRSDVYITNIVKYRPPGNRDPEPEEKTAFMPYLKRQIEVIRPKLIVFLGRHAMSTFLPELRISQAHGQPVRKDGQVYLPLFHPAAALYNGSMKNTLMDDFRLIPAILKKLS
ncbi:MAG TPA: uracil-DNA glycosylase [Candidatus Saccharimonadia bacterium]|jgi:DNA polymerase|nr:uracil-DNA glycosylase [Candidatus Saccharimonadia bacterium]